MSHITKSWKGSFGTQDRICIINRYVDIIEPASFSHETRGFCDLKEKIGAKEKEARRLKLPRLWLRAGGILTDECSEAAVYLRHAEFLGFSCRYGGYCGAVL